MKNHTNFSIGLIGLILIATGFYLYKTYNQKSNSVQQIDTSNKTEVIHYEQTYVPTDFYKGRCWTTSLATNNKSAWRCVTANNIFDPCFETNEGKIVCEVDPEKEGSGIELRLTEPLPKNTRGDSDNAEYIQPWLVKLENGATCSPATGTVGDVEDRSILYYCFDKSVLLSTDKQVLTEEMDEVFDKTGGIWKATNATIDKEFQKILNKEEVVIAKVWR